MCVRIQRCPCRAGHAELAISPSVGMLQTKNSLALKFDAYRAGHIGLAMSVSPSVCIMYLESRLALELDAKSARLVGLATFVGMAVRSSGHIGLAMGVT